MKTPIVTISIKDGKIQTIVSNVPVNYFFVNHDLQETPDEDVKNPFVQEGTAFVIRGKRKRKQY